MDPMLIIPAVIVTKRPRRTNRVPARADFRGAVEVVTQPW